MRRVVKSVDQAHQKNVQGWDKHYRRPKARQNWPDENLVRMLSEAPKGAALDLGCGSGRHLKLLFEMGFSPVLGMDTSSEAIKICQESYPDARLSVLSPAGTEFPELGCDLSVIVAWGVLHYNSPELRQSLLASVCRALSPVGSFLGTLRADSDSHYKNNPDINETPISFFSENEARSLLSAFFGDVRLGYIERRPPGELDKRICHWTFVCQKPQRPSSNTEPST